MWSSEKYVIEQIEYVECDFANVKIHLCRLALA